MTTNQPDPAPSAQTSAAASMRGAADDMAAIFGASEPPLLLVQPAARRSRGVRRGLIGAAVLALAAVTVTAGVLVGRSSTHLPPPQTVPARVQPAAHPPTAFTATVASGAGDAAPVAHADITPPAPVRIDDRQVASRVEPARAAPVTAPSTPAPRTPATPPAQLATVASPPPAPAAAPRPRACRDDDCLDDAVEVADSKLRDAFIDAQDAGVGSRTLRQYERSWDRVRELSRDAPRDALREYGMLTSDVRNLTLDAAHRRADPQ